MSTSEQEKEKETQSCSDDAANFKSVSLDPELNNFDVKNQ